MIIFGLNFGPVVAAAPALIDGLWLTITISFAAIVFGGSVGLAAAVGRSLAPRRLKWPVDVYVEVMRNTPLLIQLYIIFLGLPALGIRFSPIEASIIGLTINTGAYCTEIFRAGIESIHRSQIEAGLSLGLSRLQVVRYVVVVPAIIGVWPALVSQFILLTLASSVCSFISLEEISGAAYTIQSATFLNFEVYIVIGAMYLLLAAGLKSLLRLVGLYSFPGPSRRSLKKAMPSATAVRAQL